ncbi:hypothetical protein [Methylobacterium iners]|uniref:hypothetical protein n=1 Tax=Methylobacterium iners TaxID=418707 RepID=UPI001EE33A0C|nr:hypothetical protein [Methylobacterium iners]
MISALFYSCVECQMPTATEQTTPASHAIDVGHSPKRDLVTPVALLIGGVATVIWTTFLGWAALRLVIYAFGAG